MRKFSNSNSSLLKLQHLRIDLLVVKLLIILIILLFLSNKGIISITTKLCFSNIQFSWSNLLAFIMTFEELVIFIVY